MDGPAGDDAHEMPLWVKLFLVVGIVVVLLVIVVLVTGLGGEHGPGRHAPATDDGEPRSSGDGPGVLDHAPPVDRGPPSAVPGSITQPTGGHG